MHLTLCLLSCPLSFFLVLRRDSKLLKLTEFLQHRLEVLVIWLKESGNHCLLEGLHFWKLKYPKCLALCHYDWCAAKQLLYNMLPQSGCVHDSVRLVISFPETKQSLLNQQLPYDAIKYQVIGDNPFILSPSSSPSRNPVWVLAAQDLSCSKEDLQGSEVTCAAKASTGLAKEDLQGRGVPCVVKAYTGLASLDIWLEQYWGDMWKVTSLTTISINDKSQHCFQ